MTGDGTRITAGHLVRAACVYVRQSTPGQVRNNLESKRLQYALQTRAKELGWHTVIEQPDVWKFGTPLISHPLLSK